jgi:hypothetical protein
VTREAGRAIGNGAGGTGDIEGKIARARDERVGNRASFKSRSRRGDGGELGSALPARLCAGASRAGFGASPKRTFIKIAVRF